jgi:predicted porin
MKKSMLALAALAAFASAASAQSSVTVYGKIDMGVGQQVGAKNKEVLDGAGDSGSRLGFKGTEDLGSGLKANFVMEHRFRPDTGASNATFWNGSSTVGLSNAYGAVNIGRQYTANFSLVQNQIDPFGADTVAQFRDFVMRPRTNSLAFVENTSGTGASYLSSSRVADSVRLDFTMGAFKAAYSIGEVPAGTPAGANRPSSFAAAYSAGPIYVAAGFTNPEKKDDKVTNFGGTYNFGFAKLALGFAKGTKSDGFDTKGWLIGATVPYGAIDFKVGYGQDKVETSATAESKLKKAGFGAHYNLSKRTKVYADIAKMGGSGSLAAVPGIEKTAYDIGIQHNF